MKIFLTENLEIGESVAIRRHLDCSILQKGDVSRWVFICCADSICGDVVAFIGAPPHTPRFFEKNRVKLSILCGSVLIDYLYIPFGNQG